MTEERPLLGGIEAGGTKFVLAVGHSPDEIVARHEIPTRSPDETLAEAAEWFRRHLPLKALGIATFGPAIVDRADAAWGHIGTTPKPGWSGCDLAGYFADEFGVPVGFDTDVNGAALAESRLGAGRGVSSLAYVTVGTGIGGGLVINGKAVHGSAHPEMGHILPRRHPSDTGFEGICPAHGDCLEGLASGPAIMARWGKTLSDFPADDEAFEVIAHYLAQLCHAIFAMTAAEIIVLGGGVTKSRGLLAKVREISAALDKGYLPGSGKHRIACPGLAEDSGICGALMLAGDAIS
ncbi:ROK family protein [Croceicoccus sediminis]|uniref:ROK family protein n=1 Tax=Croceicoccus sediminis TaxID=2571150 RepID=UPI001F114399|nr:ROK family protein [Croceicoccus sediminis]